MSTMRGLLLFALLLPTIARADTTVSVSSTGVKLTALADTIAALRDEKVVAIQPRALGPRGEMAQVAFLCSAAPYHAAFLVELAGVRWLIAADRDVLIEGCPAGSGAHPRVEEKRRGTRTLDFEAPLKRAGTLRGRIAIRNATPTIVWSLHQLPSGEPNPAKQWDPGPRWAEGPIDQSESDRLRCVRLDGDKLDIAAVRRRLD